MGDTGRRRQFCTKVRHENGQRCGTSKSIQRIDQSRRYNVNRSIEKFTIAIGSRFQKKRQEGQEGQEGQERQERQERQEGQEGQEGQERQTFARW